MNPYLKKLLKVLSKEKTDPVGGGFMEKDNLERLRGVYSPTGRLLMLFRTKQDWSDTALTSVIRTTHPVLSVCFISTLDIFLTKLFLQKDFQINKLPILSPTNQELSLL